jgi:flagellar protein FlaJ
LTLSFPELPLKLRQANLNYKPEEFVQRTFKSAMTMSFGSIFIIFLLLSKYVTPINLLKVILIAFPVLFFMMFFYFFQFPQVRNIDKEIIFAGRFLIVELESGVPLFNAMKNISKNFKYVGAYFEEIVDKVSVGTPLEDAINEAVEQVPSESLTKIFWQISNSVSTGSDVVKPIQNVIETLIREQQISVSEYGRKLNPLAMFYMLIAVVVPSLGVTLLTIMSLFVGIKLDLAMLIVFVCLLGFMQFMFVAIINSSRPPMEL